MNVGGPTDGKNPILCTQIVIKMGTNGQCGECERILSGGKGIIYENMAAFLTFFTFLFFLLYQPPLFSESQEPPMLFHNFYPKSLIFWMSSRTYFCDFKFKMKYYVRKSLALELLTGGVVKNEIFLKKKNWDFRELTEGGTRYVRITCVNGGEKDLRI